MSSAARRPPGSGVEGLAARTPAWRDGAIAVPVASGAAVLLALSFGAFWPMYLAKPFSSLDRVTHAHAAIGLMWMLLLVAQPLALRRGRIPLHRSIGRLAYVVAPAFVVSGVLLAHVRFAAMDARLFVDEARFLYLPLHTALLFALAAGLGFAFRRQTALHARLMAATGLLLIDPIIVRLMGHYLPPLPFAAYQTVTFGLTDLAFVGLVLWFRPRARVARPLWALFAVMVSAHVLWFALAPSAAWLAFAQWFRALPLT